MTHRPDYRPPHKGPADKTPEWGVLQFLRGKASRPGAARPPARPDTHCPRVGSSKTFRDQGFHFYLWNNIMPDGSAKDVAERQRPTRVPRGPYQGGDEITRRGSRGSNGGQGPTCRSFGDPRGLCRRFHGCRPDHLRGRSQDQDFTDAGKTVQPGVARNRITPDRKWGDQMKTYANERLHQVPGVADVPEVPRQYVGSVRGLRGLG